MSASAKEWVNPEEFLKLQQRLQRRNNKLQIRLLQQSNSAPSLLQPGTSSSAFQQKRKNPFAKSYDQGESSGLKQTEPDVKRNRQELSFEAKSIFEQLHNTESKAPPNLEAPIIDKAKPVPDSNLATLQTFEDEDEVESDSETAAPKPTETLPIDWSIKSRVRILCHNPLSQILTKNKFDAINLRLQKCMSYYMFPSLPWLNLVKRNSSANNPFTMQPVQSESLVKHWKDCFSHTFYQLKTLQCPYFYVLTNQFSVLFRANGINGQSQTHALLTPTTCGLRKQLKDADIEFTQPLKVSSQVEVEDEDDDAEDVLKSLQDSHDMDLSGIKIKENVTAKKKLMEDDHGDLSTILIEGADCQLFFTFLLNSETIVPKVGRLAGVPPTILCPVEFPGATLCQQATRLSQLGLEGKEIHTIDVTGDAILPHTIHSLNALLAETIDNYSLTMTNYAKTVAMTKTSMKLLEDLNDSQSTCGIIFGKSNLSDCGVPMAIVDSMCRADGEAVKILERVKFKRENGGYTSF